MSGSETALERTLTEHGEGCSRTMDALEGLCSEITKDEDISKQPPGRFGDDHRAGLGRTLQPCCQIGCVADNSLLLRRAFADKIPDDDQPGGDADACLQCRSGGVRKWSIAFVTARPARAARSASSSCAFGQPK